MFLTLIKGAGDIATGIAHRLKKCGFKIVMTEQEKPMVIRRTVAFANAVFEGKAKVEDVEAVLCDYKNESSLKAVLENKIAVVVDPNLDILYTLKPQVLIDATLAKKNTGINKNMASIVIGVGPGFEAGKDVDAVVETKRGHDLGRVFLKGTATANTGIPGEINGYALERLLRANQDGVFESLRSIGEMVCCGELVAKVNNKPILAKIDGVLRGLLYSGLKVHNGDKVGDIDPRGIKDYCYTISDKARAVAGGVLEAVLVLKNDFCDKEKA